MSELRQTVRIARRCIGGVKEQAIEWPFTGYEVVHPPIDPLKGSASEISTGEVKVSSIKGVDYTVYMATVKTPGELTPAQAAAMGECLIDHINSAARGGRVFRVWEWAEMWEKALFEEHVAPAEASA